MINKLSIASKASLTAHHHAEEGNALVSVLIAGFIGFIVLQGLLTGIAGAGKATIKTKLLGDSDTMFKIIGDKIGERESEASWPTRYKNCDIKYSPRDTTMNTRDVEIKCHQVRGSNLSGTFKRTLPDRGPFFEGNSNVVKSETAAYLNKICNVEDQEFFDLKACLDGKALPYKGIPPESALAVPESTNIQ